MNIGEIIGISFVVLFFVSLLVLALICNREELSAHEENEEHIMDWHRRNGQWQVLYPDGKLSQPFTRGVAEDYASMFGGTIIPKNRE